MKQPKTDIEDKVRTLMDRGRLTEAGWKTYRGMMDPTAPPIQLRECRLAFWHGATFLFHAMLHAMEEGKVETDADMRRMSMLAAELTAFEKQLHLQRDWQLPSFTCPRCGAISYNAKDLREGYCGVCHDWS